MKKSAYIGLLLGLIATGASAEIVINEIMYNTPGSPDIEWIELYNTGPASVDLTGWTLVDDDESHPHCTLVGTLDMGAFLVVAADPAVFSAQYPGVTNVNINGFDPGGAGFGLGNGGDDVQLFNALSLLQDNVPYDDGGAWPGSADGDGPSIELVNPNLDNSVGSSWDPSVMAWGSPGVVNSTFVDDQAPTIHDTDRLPVLPTSLDGVTITAEVSDQEGLDRVELMVDMGSGYVAQVMYDDGAHGDGAAADSVFGAIIGVQPSGTLVKYYVAAYDLLGQVTTKPSTAPVRYHAYTVDHEVPYLMINEVMADNSSGHTDEAGEYDDWIEIWNLGTTACDLSGMYLTDDLDDHRFWPLPTITLDPQAYIVVWCDDDAGQGLLHAGFKLSASGEEIGLYDKEDHGNALIHGFSFGLQNPDQSIGFTHDGPTVVGGFRNGLEIREVAEYLIAPTPGEENTLGSTPVVLNEFQTTSSEGGVDDWIELYNRSDSPVDVGGWGLSDDVDDPLRWTFPIGTILQPQEFIVVDELTLGFGLSSTGESIVLTGADGYTGLDYIKFGPQIPDASFGRYGGGLSFWYTMLSPTPGTENPIPISVPDQTVLPQMLKVSGATPNPFNPSTQIGFELPHDADVTVRIYGIDGRLVRTLNAGTMTTGRQSVFFDGLDDRGRSLASGIWFARVYAGSQAATVKMTLLK